MQKKWADRLFGGLLLIGVGVLFMLDVLNVIDISIGDIFSTYWPLILILLGVRELLKGRKNFAGAAVLILVGTYFLGQEQGWGFSVGGLFKIALPVLLIIGGLNVLFKSNDSRPSSPKVKRKEDIEIIPDPPEPVDMTAESTLDQQFEEKFGIPFQERAKDKEHINVRPKREFINLDKEDYHPFAEDDDYDEDDDDFHDMKKRLKKQYKENYKSHYKRFKHEAREHRRNGRPTVTVDWDDSDYGPGHEREGGSTNRSSFIGDIHVGREYFQLKNTNISQFIGDSVLDLTNAQIPYGETKINLSAFIGDIKVYVPHDADLGIRVNSSSFIGDMTIIGETRSGFMSNVDIKTPYYKEASKKIKINVSAFIGDIKVNRVG
ncbi:cell wall-active antibiotics response protein LiaF [Paenibacillus pini]|uniref:Transporter LiaF n=1 Tax=Paenibacillus pini JCM 16418 TaxID=1236976 RepID=W7YCP4_9BACL|nr:cell wall-active antibiotics response protein LiaF [Paenibacillus pini]GAF06217.1 transporter LiaF [Paenibacillus pini JCM 16418]